jgi:xylulokinase
MGERKEALFLGYDLGSHGAKGAIYTLEGKKIASAARSHSIERPEPGWQEQDPEGLWWREFCEIVSELVIAVSAAPGGAALVELAGIGITGFVPALCVLDNGGRAVRPAIMHTDVRAGSELEEANALLPHPITLGTLLPKLLWLRKHEPHNWNRIARVMVPHSYLVYRLTGRMVCDFDTASIYGGLFDEDRLCWNEEICRELGLDPGMLPEPVAVTSAAGELVAGAAREISPFVELAPGAKVIAGSGDSFAALAGEGASRPGDLMIYLGSSATRILLEAPVDDISCGPHYGEGKARFTGRIFSCGESMEHYRILLGHNGWGALDEAASRVPAGSEGLFVFPHLKQRRDDEKGLLDREGIVGLESSHGQGHLFRAFLEGVAFQLKMDLEEEASPVRRIFLAGGGARSDVFASIIASVLERELLITPGGGGTAGIALLAACTLGCFSSLEEGGKQWFVQGKTILPDPEQAEKYRKTSALYRTLRQKNDEINRMIDHR